MNKKVSQGVKVKVGRDLIDILFWIYQDMKFDKDIIFKLAKKEQNSKVLQQVIVCKENENGEDTVFMLHMISPIDISIKIKTGENESLAMDEFV